MSKRKTRKQKKISDLRRVSSTQTISSTMISLPQQHHHQQQSAYTIAYNPAKSVIPFSHAYLKHDLTKTTLVTGAIIILQIILFFMLKNHIINIPYLNY